jgi:hypothetical protein
MVTAKLTKSALCIVLSPQYFWPPGWHARRRLVGCAPIKAAMRTNAREAGAPQ